MATSQVPTETYKSDAFVETVGTILFRLSSREICILHDLRSDEYVLFKGRRNCAETRQWASVRQVTQKTGLTCGPLLLNMPTRAPSHIETAEVADEARVYNGIREPFTLQICHPKEGDVKVVWWYIVSTFEEMPTELKEKYDNWMVTLNEGVQEKEHFAVEFYSYEEAPGKLTSQMERDMVKEAIATVVDTVGDTVHEIIPIDPTRHTSHWYDKAASSSQSWNYWELFWAVIAILVGWSLLFYLGILIGEKIRSAYDMGFKLRFEDEWCKTIRDALAKHGIESKLTCGESRMG